MLARTWSIECPPGMLAHGERIKRFTSPTAFDGYVHALRARGYTVRFDTPFFASVEAWK